jgi:hypothetical protein
MMQLPQQAMCKAAFQGGRCLQIIASMLKPSQCKRATVAGQQEVAFT